MSRKRSYCIEFAGEAIRSLSMEGRMTVCNMSIECGARGGMIAPDRTTFDYLRGRERAPQGAAFDQAVARWEALYSDADAVFDKEYRFDAADIAPMITYGTNPGMGMAVDAQIPAEADPKALEYMGFKAGEKLLGKPVDYVFVGSCTNGRIEDLQRFAKLVEGRRKAQGADPGKADFQTSLLRNLTITELSQFSTDSCKRIRVCPRNIPGSIRCLLRRLNHIRRDSQHFRCFQLLLAASGPAAVFRDHMADVVLL